MAAEIPDGGLEKIGRLLHDLAQPLTLLQWRLELGRMSDDPAELKASIDEALGDTERLFASLKQMRAELFGENVSDRG